MRGVREPLTAEQHHDQPLGREPLDVAATQMHVPAPRAVPLPHHIVAAPDASPMRHTGAARAVHHRTTVVAVEAGDVCPRHSIRPGEACAPAATRISQLTVPLLVSCCQAPPAVGTAPVGARIATAHPQLAQLLVKCGAVPTTFSSPLRSFRLDGWVADDTGPVNVRPNPSDLEGLLRHKGEGRGVRPEGM